MSLRRIYIRHSGHWERTSYVGGDLILVHLPVFEITRDHILQEIRDQVGEDFEFLLFYLTDTSDHGKVKVVLRSDADLLRLIVEQQDKATIYAINKDVNIGRGTFTTQRSSIYEDVNFAEPSSEPLDSEEEREDPEVEEERAGEERDAEERTDLFASLTTEFGAWIREPGQIDRVIGHRSINSDHQPSRDSNAQADPDAIRAWLIPHVDLDTAFPLGHIDLDSAAPLVGELRVGGVFKKKCNLSIAVGLHHMENRQEYHTENSDKGRVGYVCKNEGCKFLLRAKQKHGIWIIKKYTPEHTCEVDIDSNAPRQVPAKVLGAFFARRLITEGAVLKPKEMVNEMRVEYGIEIDYSFALRARNIAIEMTYGGFEESYERLPSYLYLLRERNPGTVYDICTSHSNDRLCYMFLALGQSIQAFRNDLLRPVIVVDGTHLKGKNKGTLFVAVTKDGNEQVFPLAIGFGPIENDDSWIWFLRRVRSAFGAPEGLMIVSDQHISIEHAIQVVYPDAHHALCFYHITKNMVGYGRHALGIFESAAYSYLDSNFDEYFEALRSNNRNGGGMYQRLCDIGLARWALSKCPVPRTSFMTSNAAETMNARLLWARRLPICAMLEVYRIIVEKWFDEHRARAVAREHELTEKTYMKMSAAAEWARHYTARGTTVENTYRVEGDTGTYLVDLQNCRCDCREFDLDLIPCRHACAALRFSGRRKSDYVSHYFKQSTLVAAYSPNIEPIPHPASWNVPEEVRSLIVRPPLVQKRAGRPRMSRARSTVEGTSISNIQQRCSRCKGYGHKRRSCTASLPEEGINLNIHNEERRRRAKKKCSICKSEEHTRPRCPMRPSD